MQGGAGGCPPGRGCTAGLRSCRRRVCVQLSHLQHQAKSVCWLHCMFLGTSCWTDYSIWMLQSQHKCPSWLAKKCKAVHPPDPDPSSRHEVSIAMLLVN